MYSDYMRESVEELRHKETLAFLIMIMGMISLMGGLTMTSILAGQISWFLILPFDVTSSPSSLLGITLTLLGFGLTSAGFILAIYYDREKNWFQGRIKVSSPIADALLKKGKKKH